MLQLNNCTFSQHALQPASPTPQLQGQNTSKPLKKPKVQWDHLASSRKYPQRISVSNVDEEGEIIRMGKGQSTHINSVHLSFRTLEWNSNLPCLRVTKESAFSPKGSWFLLYALHAHKPSMWLNRCQVWKELWGSSGERVSKTCTKQIFMVYKYT